MNLVVVVIGSVVGSLAGLLTIVWLSRLLVDRVRFRRPLFRVDDAELSVIEQEGYRFVGRGYFSLYVRGAAEPVRLTHRTVTFRDGDKLLGGLGSEVEIDVPSRVWKRIVLTLKEKVGWDVFPSTLGVDIGLSNPSAHYQLRVPLELLSDGSKYGYHGPSQWEHYLGGYFWPRAGLVRRLLRAVSRDRLG